MARIRINTRYHTKEKPYLIISKLVRQKCQYGEQNKCMYMSDKCAEGIFVTFPW